MIFHLPQHPDINPHWHGVMDFSPGAPRPVRADCRFIPWDSTPLPVFLLLFFYSPEFSLKFPKAISFRLTAKHYSVTLRTGAECTASLIVVLCEATRFSEWAFQKGLILIDHDQFIFSEHPGCNTMVIMLQALLIF